MARRLYEQYCGLARALELVGERWALLIVRDLLVGPRRYTDLSRGLPRIPTNVLATRLRELEDAGVVRRRLLPRPFGAVVYDLTEYGRDLEPAVAALGRWGARALGSPRPTETVTPESLTIALRSTFDPAGAGRVRTRYELRVGPIVLSADVHRGKVVVTGGARPDPDLVIETGPQIKSLMAGELSPADAIESGVVRLTGDAQLLTRFVKTFPVGPAPARVA